MKKIPERKPFGQRLVAGMEEGLASLQEGRVLPRTFVAAPPDPPAFNRNTLASLRRHCGMSQSTFAKLLNVSVKAVESWEQGVRRPNGAALRLLQFMERPELFLRMLGAGDAAARPASERQERKS